MTVKLFWCPKTRASRALWLLEEIGEPFELVLADIRDPKSITDPDFRAASPMGKVPALVDGETKMSDSAAICMYLADRFPDAGLAPKIGDPARGEYLYWMMYTPGVIEPAMAEKFGGWEPKKHSHGWGDFDSMISVLEDRMRDCEWLLGDNFSAADVMVGSSVYFLKLFGALSDNAVLDAYADRCGARPAYQRALARDA